MSFFINNSQPLQPAQPSFAAYDLTEDITLVWPFGFLASNLVVAANMNFDSSSNYTVTLPDATQASVGTTFIVNNIGTSNVTLASSEGADTWTLVAGLCYYFLLIDNTTVDGTWQYQLVGATSSGADANLLAGNGLISLASTLPPGTNRLNTNIVINPVAGGPYEVTIADRASLLVSPDGGALTAVLLNYSADIPSGFYFSLSNQNTFPFDVDATGGSIDGATTLALDPQDSVTVVCAGGGIWYTVGGLNSSSTSSLSIARVSLNGVPSPYTLPAEQAKANVIIFSGLLTAPFLVYFPQVNAEWLVENQTSGGEALAIRMTNGITGVGNIYEVGGGERLSFLGVGSGGAPSLFAYPKWEPGTPESLGTFNNLSPATALNEVLVNDGTSTIGLPAPTAPNQVLVCLDPGDIISWQAIPDPLPSAALNEMIVNNGTTNVALDAPTSSNQVLFCSNPASLISWVDASDQLPSTSLNEMIVNDGTTNVALAAPSALGSTLYWSGGTNLIQWGGITTLQMSGYTSNTIGSLGTTFNFEGNNVPRISGDAVWTVWGMASWGMTGAGHVKGELFRLDAGGSTLLGTVFALDLVAINYNAALFQASFTYFDSNLPPILTSPNVSYFLSVTSTTPAVFMIPNGTPDGSTITNGLTVLTMTEVLYA